jgi:hypothetical protein
LGTDEAMNTVTTDMGTTYLLGDTVTDHQLKQPIGFVHFPDGGTASNEVKRGRIIVEGRPTAKEMRDFWTVVP